VQWAKNNNKKIMHNAGIDVSRWEILAGFSALFFFFFYQSLSVYNMTTCNWISLVRLYYVWEKSEDNLFVALLCLNVSPFFFFFFFFFVGFFFGGFHWFFIFLHKKTKTFTCVHIIVLDVKTKSALSPPKYPNALESLQCTNSKTSFSPWFLLVERSLVSRD
jgi:hypothetical protein